MKPLNVRTHSRAEAKYFTPRKVLIAFNPFMGPKYPEALEYRTPYGMWASPVGSRRCPSKEGHHV